MVKSAKFLIGALFVTLLLSGCGAKQHPSDKTNPETKSGTPARAGGTYLDQILSPKVLGAQLVDSEGNKFTFADLKGKYLVIANFLTSCQEICPMTSANIRDIGDAISKAGLSNKIVAMVLSVDPERDNPARLKAYKDLYGSSNWLVASATPESTDLIWKYFGAPPKRETFSVSDLKSMPKDWQTGKPNTYDMVHADLVVIVDDKSHWRWLDLGSPQIREKNIPEKLKEFLSPAGLANLTKPEEPTWSTFAVLSALNDLTGSKLK